MLFNNAFGYLVHLLIIPVSATTAAYNLMGENKLVSHVNLTFDVTGFSHRRDVITKLPPEILDMIFDNMDSLEESLVLGITCRRLWPFALHRFCEWMRGQIGQWAGEKLVTIGGEGDEEGDYPPGLFSESEINDLNEEGVPEYDFKCECCRKVKAVWQFTMGSKVRYGMARCSLRS